MAQVNLHWNNEMLKIQTKILDIFYILFWHVRLYIIIRFCFIFGPYEKICDDLQVYFSELSDNHTLDIETSVPCEQIFDVLKGYFSESPDDHTLDIETSGPYGQICDELQ